MTSNSSSTRTVSFFPTPALDHAFAGIGAGAVATICMNPLDLIKVKFQVDSRPPLPLSLDRTIKGLKNTSFKKVMTGGKVGRDMVGALKEIVNKDGWKGLYKGLSPNVVGNSASWGLYFLWYTMIKEYMANSSNNGAGLEGKKLSAGQHLLAASESGAITALMTNPIWVVKTRMFTSPSINDHTDNKNNYNSTINELRKPSIQSQSQSHLKSQSITSSSSSSQNSFNSTSPPNTNPNSNSTSPSTSQSNLSKTNPNSHPYRTLTSSLKHIYKTEGFRGLWKGAGLALVGVSNGAIQFMAYEEMKKWRSNVEFKKREENGEGLGEVDENGIAKLTNLEYIIISGSAKMVAIFLTYPYQVIRSRVQNHNTSHLYPSVLSCVKQTYQFEGPRAFYKGMAANAIRILPGTCVTFVVYENISFALRKAARSTVDVITAKSIDDTRKESC